MKNKYIEKRKMKPKYLLIEYYNQIIRKPCLTTCSMLARFVELCGAQCLSSYAYAPCSLMLPPTYIDRQSRRT